MNGINCAATLGHKSMNVATTLRILSAATPSSGLVFCQECVSTNRSGLLCCQECVSTNRSGLLCCQSVVKTVTAVNKLRVTGANCGATALTTGRALVSSLL